MNVNKLVLAAVTFLSFTACQEKDLFDPNYGKESAEEVARKIDLSFDYNMMTEVPVVLNYSRQGAFIQIVDCNERDAATAMSGQTPTVLYAAYTGADGHYEGKMTIPSSYIGKTVYAVTKSMGVTSNIAVKVTASGIVVNEHPAATRGVRQANQSVSEALLATIDAQLPEQQDNSGKLMEKSDDISIKVNEDCDYIDVTFIYGGAGKWISGHFKDAQFSCQKDEYEHDSWFPYDTSCDLYYFLYTDDNVPTKEYIDTYYINDHHRVVDYVNNTNSGIYGKDPEKVGVTVRITQDDGITTKIKAGTRIGWVVTHPYYTYVDVWDASLSGWTVPNLYSISAYNPGGYSQSIRYQQGEGADRQLIYGFEDSPLQDGIKLWGETWEQHLEHMAAGQPTDQHYFFEPSDRDYNDVLFTVKASNPDAIVEQEIPVLPPAQPVINEESIEGTLLYEDLYPSQGDYDMNDVVVTYRLTKYFNEANELVKVGYEFTPVWSGANLHSAFSFLLDGWTDAPVRVFDDQLKYVNAYKATDRLTTFSGELTEGRFIDQPKDALTWDAFNPFITVSNGYEVHLTKKPSSPSARLDGLNEYQKAYVNEGNFPFAMNIPTKNFVIVSERTRIDSQYPRFVDWVESRGQQAADWYLIP